MTMIEMVVLYPEVFQNYICNISNYSQAIFPSKLDKAIAKA